MGGFIGRLFGSEKALESAVDGVKNGLDKLFYTKEEQAVDAAHAVTEARAMVVKWMEATQGQNLSRRLISLVITGVWVSQYMIAQLLTVIAIWSDSKVELTAAAKVLYDGAYSMDSAVMLILAFYFAAPYMGTVVDKFFNKESK